jgi:demethylmenaquinone methyltransferase/2-methoxy-6-polyprenyl-1,4-benzoquinol methylase
MPRQQDVDAKSEAVDDPAGTLDTSQVQAMFDRIAGVYDPLNDAISAGLHHHWRARAADMARVSPGSRVLDVATGTGDLALELARRVAPGGKVVGSDFSEGMLARARLKAQADARLDLRFEQGDALELPYADDSFDAATVGFGARTFSDLARGLSEMARVVRPGGRVVVLEITTPTRPPLSLFYQLWFDRMVPVIGQLAGALAAGASRVGLSSRSGSGAGIADAYTYLPNSVKCFPGPVALAHELQGVGLREISYVLTAGGMIAIHAGSVPMTPVGGDSPPDGAALSG